MLHAAQTVAMSDAQREFGLKQTATSPNVDTLPASRERSLRESPDHVNSEAEADQRSLPPVMIINDDGTRRRAMPLLDDENHHAKNLVKARLFGPKTEAAKIGRFTILDRLGEGGMGVVFIAYDDQLDRRIAVKVLRGEAFRHNDVHRARLLREAQAMARLSHPNIVTVHEVGALTEEMFIAMELVRGHSLDVWLKKNVPPWRVVLEAFIKAGRGLTAAHRAGIVHRDFKPQNVLVGDDGVVKVLDFGLACASDHGGTGELRATAEIDSGNRPRSPLETSLTCTGAVMGTLAYMAPEQHEGQQATAQSDQFSFCVSLFEALYGLHPFDCGSLGALIDGVTTGRVLEPPTATKVPTWLRRAVVRGLAVDPRNRHPSMTALLAELGKDPAVIRRRWATTAGVATFVAAVSFGAGSMHLAATEICKDVEAEFAGVWDRERSETVRKAMLATGVPHAAQTWSRVGPRLDAYTLEWSTMRQEACETHAAAKQSDQVFDLRNACLDQHRNSVKALVDILADADADVVENAVTAVIGLPAVEDCKDTQALAQTMALPEDPALQQKIVAARAVLARAQVHQDTGQYARGIALTKTVLVDADVTSYGPLLAEALLCQGTLELWMGDASRAHADLEGALRAAVAAGYATVAAQSISRDLFVRGHLLRQPAEALQGLKLAEAHVDHAGDPLVTAEFLHNLGVVHMDAGDILQGKESTDEALTIKRSVLPEDHPEIIYTLGNLATMELIAHQFDFAEAQFDDLLAIVQRTLGPHHPLAASIEYNLGYTLRMQGRPFEAKPHLERALAVHVENAMKVNPPREFFNIQLGAAAVDLREYGPARANFAAAAAIIRAKGGDEVSEASLHEGLGDLAGATGDFAAARVEHQTAVALRRKINGVDDFDTAYGHQRFAAMLLRAGEANEAMPHLKEALSVYERWLPPESPIIAETLTLIDRAGLLRCDDGMGGQISARVQ